MKHILKIIYITEGIKRHFQNRIHQEEDFSVRAVYNGNTVKVLTMASLFKLKTGYTEQVHLFGP